MATVTLAGELVNLSGDLPIVGESAPEFVLADDAMRDVRLADFAGRRKILNIFPSLDTPVCAESVRQFSQRVDSQANAAMLTVSMDLPFASWRFCDSLGLKNVIPVSAFRAPAFGDDYGVRILDGKLRGLLARAVVVINSGDAVVYAQLVPEIKQEPDYESAIAALTAAD